MGNKDSQMTDELHLKQIWASEAKLNACIPTEWRNPYFLATILLWMRLIEDEEETPS